MYIQTTKPEILLVGFGNLSALKSDFKKAFAGHRIISAKTASEGVSKLQSNNVVIQPIYLLPGFEYERLCGEAAACGKQAVVGTPLLSSDENIAALAKILLNEYGQNPTLFAGHGSRHPLGEAVYARLSDALRKVGFARAYIGVLEGRPDFDIAMKQFRQDGILDITLTPLTLTAGKHVREDIFGKDAASLESRLTANGFSVAPVYQTLLDLSAVRQMFIELCRSVLKDGEGPSYVRPRV